MADSRKTDSRKTDSSNVENVGSTDSQEGKDPDGAGGGVLPDLFDVSALKLSQDFEASVSVRKLITTVPVRKPGRQDFVRVHPDPNFHLETAVLELKEDRETYLVDPKLWSTIPGELTPKVLFTAINRQGVLTLWPIRLPGNDGRLDDWNSSALEAAQIAKDCWIRMTSNMALGAYEVFEALGDLPEPEWPDMGFAEILKVAFKDRFVDDIGHPAVQRLRGEL